MWTKRSSGDELTKERWDCCFWQHTCGTTLVLGWWKYSVSTNWILLYLKYVLQDSTKYGIRMYLQGKIALSLTSLLQLYCLVSKDVLFDSLKLWKQLNCSISPVHSQICHLGWFPSKNDELCCRSVSNRQGKQSKIVPFCLGKILPVKIRSCSVLVFWEVVCIDMQKYLSLWWFVFW